MKKLAILIFAALIGFSATAQNAKVTTAPSSNSKTATATSTTSIQKVVIQTNGVCSKCEALFKENVPFFKGVKDYAYDPKTSKMTITYDSKKTNPDLLRQQISKLGYNADNVKADPAARAKLPACCQVDKKPGQEAGCSGHSGCSGHGNSGCGGCNGHKH
ncbi:MAG: cation transporter [Bacteroidales bacterium]|nr:cation transporter [Bacteroidales bacterium]